MKATLEFNLWEDAEEFKHAQNGVMYYGLIEEFREWLKRREDTLSECDTDVDVHRLVEHEATIDKFHEIFGEVL